MSQSPCLLFLHAHPDDECILTGVTMAVAKSYGFRVLVAYATRGDAGETKKDLGGQSLGERRTDEALAACAALAVDRVEFLGFVDSGMADTETTANPSAFCNVELDTIATRTREVFEGESITAVIGYDRNGTYGHPDHIKVHHSAHHLAPVVGASWVLEATYHREYMASLPDNAYGDIGPNFASASEELTHFVESEAALLAKLDAISHHQSQVPDDFDTDEPDVAGFAAMFGTEWYISTAVNEEADWAPLETMFVPKAQWSGRPPLAS
jgi:LmbE family N-acetylglucosaminyl deacetylase